jgi:hypothetical protein
MWRYIMLKELINLASHLDSKGLAKEADYLDNIIKIALTHDQLAPDLAPSSSNYMQDAPDDAGKMIRDTMMGLLPVIGSTYDIVSISRSMARLAAELEKPNPNTEVISNICKDLAINGGLFLVSVIPFGKILSGAKVLKTSPDAMKLIKSSPVKKSTTAADVDGWDWSEIMDQAQIDQDLYRSTRVNPLPDNTGFVGYHNPSERTIMELDGAEADALFENIWKSLNK